jgi:hypothetical protein
VRGWVPCRVMMALVAAARVSSASGFGCCWGEAGGFSSASESEEFEFEMLNLPSGLGDQYVGCSLSVSLQ